MSKTAWQNEYFSSGAKELKSIKHNTKNNNDASGYRSINMYKLDIDDGHLKLVFHDICNYCIQYLSQSHAQSLK